MGSLANNLFTSSGEPAAGAQGRSGDLRSEFDLIEAGFYRLRRFTMQVYFEDANNGAQARYVPLPSFRGGTIKRITVVPSANNGGAACVFTAGIGATPIVMPALELGAAAAAGTAVGVVPTSDNTYVNTGLNTLRISSDGGGNTVMPVMVTIEIED